MGFPRGEYESELPFPPPGVNPGLLLCRWILYHRGNPSHPLVPPKFSQVSFMTYHGLLVSRLLLPASEFSRSVFLRQWQQAARSTMFLLRVSCYETTQASTLLGAWFRQALTVNSSCSFLLKKQMWLQRRPSRGEPKARVTQLL